MKNNLLEIASFFEKKAFSELNNFLKNNLDQEDIYLPEDPWKYFYETKDCFLVKLDELVTTRARPKGIRNAEKYMKMAYDGEGDRRKPINVSRRPDGKWNVEDGNSTTAIALKHNWKKIPAVEVEPGLDSDH